jgi:hypothetical protein
VDNARERGIDQLIFQCYSSINIYSASTISNDMMTVIKDQHWYLVIEEYVIFYRMPQTPSLLMRLPDLPKECDSHGNIEYKLKLINPTQERLQHLITQMKWRYRFKD